MQNVTTEVKGSKRHQALRGMRFRHFQRSRTLHQREVPQVP